MTSAALAIVGVGGLVVKRGVASVGGNVGVAEAHSRLEVSRGRKDAL